MTELCICELTGANTQLSSCGGFDGLTLNAICQTTEYSPDELLFLTESVTSGQIGYVFAWGVAAVLTLFALGYGVQIIKRLLNLA